MITSLPVNPTRPISDWLVIPKPNRTASLRLFCFPYAGAGSTVYRAWVDSLPKDVELVSWLFPGRESRLRTPPFVSIRPLIKALSAEIAPLLDKPFAFFGHSLGGLLAFELVRELRRQNSPLPVHLFISSRRAAHLPDPRSPISGLPDDEFADEIQKRYNGIPSVIQQDPELMNLFLPILKADFSVFESYEYADEPALDIPLSIYKGSQDAVITQMEVEAWQIHSSRPMSVQVFPGDHFYLQSQRSALLNSVSSVLGGYIK